MKKTAPVAPVLVKKVLPSVVETVWFAAYVCVNDFPDFEVAELERVRIYCDKGKVLISAQPLALYLRPRVPRGCAALVAESAPSCCGVIENFTGGCSNVCHNRARREMPIHAVFEQVALVVSPGKTIIISPLFAAFFAALSVANGAPSWPRCAVLSLPLTASTQRVLPVGIVARAFALKTQKIKKESPNRTRDFLINLEGYSFQKCQVKSSCAWMGTCEKAGEKFPSTLCDPPTRNQLASVRLTHSKVTFTGDHHRHAIWSRRRRYC